MHAPFLEVGSQMSHLQHQDKEESKKEHTDTVIQRGRDAWGFSGPR
jgi:hypothetical protein